MTGKEGFFMATGTVSTTFSVMMQRPPADGAKVAFVPAEAEKGSEATKVAPIVQMRAAHLFASSKR